MTNVWVHDPTLPRDIQSIFDPFGNAVHTSLHFPVLGEDVLDTGERVNSNYFVWAVIGNLVLLAGCVTAVVMLRGLPI